MPKISVRSIFEAIRKQCEDNTIWEELCWFIDKLAPSKLIPFHTNYPQGFRDKYPNAIIGKREIEV